MPCSGQIESKHLTIQKLNIRVFHNPAVTHCVPLPVHPARTPLRQQGASQPQAALKEATTPALLLQAGLGPKPSAYGLAKPDPWPLLGLRHTTFRTDSHNQQTTVRRRMAQPGSILRHCHGRIQRPGGTVAALNHEADGSTHVWANQRQRL